MDVLICEDDPVTRLVITDLVEDQGGRVLAAVDSPVEALAFLARFSPTIVILDLVLRHGSGLGLLDRLRAMDPAPQVIVFTAYDALVDLDDDSIRLVQKPDFGRLARVIASVGEAGESGERRRPVRHVAPNAMRSDTDAAGFYELIAGAQPDDVLVSVAVDADADEVVRALREALRNHDAVLPRTDRVVALLLGGGTDTVRAIQQRFEQAYPALADRATTLVVGDDPIDTFARLTST